MTIKPHDMDDILAMGEEELDALRARFKAHTVKKKGGCWETDFFRNPTGYGYMSVLSKRRYTHRLSQVLYNDPIPEGKYVRHTCGNRACVNPKHLFVGTDVDSVTPRAKKCPRSVTLKLTVKDVVYMRQRRRAGKSIAAMARKFGISMNTACFAIKGKTWKQVDAIEPPVKSSGRNDIPPKVIKMIVREYKRGTSRALIAEKAGFCVSSIYRVIRVYADE
jgi:hypothetical protein